MLLLALLLPSALQAREKDIAGAAFETAMSFKITGKGHYGQCYSYAGDLYARMADLGAETYMITYDWKKNGRTGRHSIVVYNDGRNRYWGMDNMSRKPVWLEGDSLEALVLSFEARAGSRWNQPQRVAVQVLAYATNAGSDNVSRIYAVNP